MKLTEYAHGAGCGCKIAPKVLEEILATQWTIPHAALLVGNDARDDAAVYDLGGGQGLISTTDFFMPIVDDAFDFGRVAAANAISDVYAMGGKPLMALAILGWPVDKLPASEAHRVMEGARAICAEAGIPLAGGHSIDTLEPMFGLSVNGLVALNHLKRNGGAAPGDLLYLTKPVGVGILTTAAKKGQLLPEHEGLAIEQLVKLNALGELLGQQQWVKAMTDLTGFGLAGHVLEMADASSCSVELRWSQIPFIADLSFYLKNRVIPDAVYRNWSASGNRIGFETGVPVGDAFSLLSDPQTNGGLLIAVDPKHESDMKSLLLQQGLEPFIQPIGQFIEKGEKGIHVRP